jgi:thymidine kinase
MRGRLELIVGSMFAGKTTLLINRLEAAHRAGARCGAFKHASDRRYHECELATHDERRLPAEPVRDAAELAALASAIDVIGLDEAHFFDHALVDVTEHMLAKGRRLIVAGLEYDAWGQRFPWIAALKASADLVDVLAAPCRVCGAPAVFSMRVVPLAGPDMVGGPGQYEPRCPAHFEPLAAPAPRY